MTACDYSFDPAWWSDVSDDARDLIRKLLVVDAAARLRAESALLHPWLLAGEHELATRCLARVGANMQRLTARQKFKGAVKTVLFARRHAAVASASGVEAHVAAAPPGDEPPADS